MIAVNIVKVIEWTLFRQYTERQKGERTDGGQDEPIYTPNNYFVWGMKTKTACKSHRLYFISNAVDIS